MVYALYGLTPEEKTGTAPAPIDLLHPSIPRDPRLLKNPIGARAPPPLGRVGRLALPARAALNAPAATAKKK